jgi:EpsI family protein
MMFRSAVLIALFAGAFAVRSSLDAPRIMTSAVPLAQFPASLDEWQGRDFPLEPDVIKVAAVNDYLNRQYQSSTAGLGLYIGYYQSQRQGEALHSPLFCLPGSGWQPVKTETTDLQIPGEGGGARTINALIVERGLDRLLVLYWYQTFGRVIASEYWRKLFLMHDALLSGRTDVALIRITTTIKSRDAAGETNSLNVARPFAERILPEVQHRLFRP